MFEEDKIIETKAIKKLRSRFNKIIILFIAAICLLLFSQYKQLFVIKTVFILLIFIVTIYLTHQLYELEELTDNFEKRLKQLEEYQELDSKTISHLVSIAIENSKENKE